MHMSRLFFYAASTNKGPGCCGEADDAFGEPSIVLVSGRMAGGCGACGGWARVAPRLTRALPLT